MIEERRTKQMEEVVSILSKCVNSLPGHPNKFGKALADEITRDHRTLQQLMIGTLFEALVAIGGIDPVFTDLRNEASYKACRELRRMVNNEEFNISFPLV
jgi:hypothetical protein